MKRKKPIHIDLNELGMELVLGKGDKCLDRRTGDIVSAADCQADDIGEGRPGFRVGKRFIRIPQFDEAHIELSEQEMTNTKTAIAAMREHIAHNLPTIREREKEEVAEVFSNHPELYEKILEGERALNELEEKVIANKPELADALKEREIEVRLAQERYSEIVDQSESLEEAVEEMNEADKAFDSVEAAERIARNWLASLKPKSR